MRPEESRTEENAKISRHNAVRPARRTALIVLRWMERGREKHAEPEKALYLLNATGPCSEARVRL
jgi:hypothetical protein